MVISTVSPAMRSDRAELATDVPLGVGDRRDQGEDFVGIRIRREVEVVRRASEEGITNRATHERELLARRGECS